MEKRKTRLDFEVLEIDGLQKEKKKRVTPQGEPKEFYRSIGIINDNANGRQCGGGQKSRDCIDNKTSEESWQFSFVSYERFKDGSNEFT